jgi:hypothetical protein
MSISKELGKDYPYITNVTVLKQLGIIKGDGYGNLSPHEYTSREEAMLIAHRVIKTLQSRINHP